MKWIGVGVTGIFVVAGAVFVVSYKNNERHSRTATSSAVFPPVSDTNIETPVVASTSLEIGNSKNIVPRIVYASGDYAKSLKTKDGLTRTYIVHVPRGYDPNKIYPLVVVLHGGFGSGANVENQTSLSLLADTNGFIAVYPDGVANSKGTRTWNAGACCGNSSVENIDDVGFIKQLITSLESTYNINAKRIFATGMSNGAMLANRLACEASELFTAVAPVSGTVQVPWCSPKRPVPILMVHGTDDGIVLFNGGSGTSPVTKGNTFIPVMQTLSQWATLNTCADGKVITSIPSLSTDSITIDKIEYMNCSAQTVLYRINGGGHSWPGGTPGRAQESAVPTKSFDASNTIWSFFSAF